MEFWQAITERKSIRIFKPDPVPRELIEKVLEAGMLPVPRELIEKVLEAGMLAPSSANMQPWEFVVICGEEKDKLSQSLLQVFSDKRKDYDFEGKQIQFPPALIKRRRDFFSELFQKLEDRDLNPKRFLQESTLRFWDAPVIILVFMDGRIASRFFFDIGACVQNIALAAKAEGLDTHLIGQKPKVLIPISSA
jgi:nitroreductase